MPDTPSNAPGPDKKNLLIEQLEERALFNAVPVAPIDAQAIEADATAYLETVVNAISADAEAGANQQEQVAKREVLFVDKSVEGYESIVADFVATRDVDVFFINDQSSGFEQIANHLEGRSGIEAIHIVSHGNDAQLNLGNSVVTQEDLAGQHTSELVRIGQSLTEFGDILIYGCDLASTVEGEAFISELSSITNADVAASDDLTGSALEGGDWDLEKSTGSIEALSLSSSSFSSTLLVSDNGFTIGTSPIFVDGETAIVPEGQPGTSTFVYANAATANNGAIDVDVHLTLVNTFDELGNLTTGQANQLPVTFSNWDQSPVVLSRFVGASATGFEGHTAEIRVDFFDQATGNPLSIVGDFTFQDIDYEPPQNTGSGAEAIIALSDEVLGYTLSADTEIEDSEQNGETTFTNFTGNGSPNDQERWVGIRFIQTTSHTLIFQSRAVNTGYGLTTRDFDNPVNFTPPTATDDFFATDQDSTIVGNVITANNGAGADSDPDGDALSVMNVNGLTANVGSAITGTNGGQFTIDSDGTVEFDPDGDFDFLAEGQTTTTTVNYQVGDGTGLTDEATVTVTITGTNDDPIVGGNLPPQTNQDLDTITSVDITSVFSDPDGDTLTYTAIGLPTGLSLDLNNGSISGVIDNSASQGGPNNDGIYLIEVTATDSLGASVSTTFSWAVTNPGPTAFDNTNSVSENISAPSNGNVITDDDGVGIDSDPDGDDLTVTSFDGSTANVGSAISTSYGTITVSSDGSYAYTCLLYTSPSPRDQRGSRMPSSA